MITSKHLVTDVTLYEEATAKVFRIYGNIEDCSISFCFPPIWKRGSSLIYMVKDLIELSNHPESGFTSTIRLIAKLNDLEEAGQNVILIGVTFAFTDLIEKQQFKLQQTIIMETGMKGRREMIREELRSIM
jgi:hypothetical protein